MRLDFDMKTMSVPDAYDHRHYFSIKIGCELFIVCDGKDWIFDLRNGAIKELESSFLHRKCKYDDHDNYEDLFHYYGYDTLSMIDSNARYCYELTQHKFWGNKVKESFDLWCYDKVDKRYFECFDGVEIDERVMVKKFDIVLFRDELVISGKTKGIGEGQTVLYKMKFTSQHS